MDCFYWIDSRLPHIEFLWRWLPTLRHSYSVLPCSALWLPTRSVDIGLISASLAATLKLNFIERDLKFCKRRTDLTSFFDASKTESGISAKLVNVIVTQATKMTKTKENTKRTCPPNNAPVIINNWLLLKTHHKLLQIMYKFQACRD